METPPAQLGQPEISAEIDLKPPVYTPEVLALNPEARVDYYLASHAELFKQTGKIWADLDVAQDGLIRHSHDITARFKSGELMLPSLNRQQRRQAQRDYGKFINDPGEGLAAIAQSGIQMFEKHGRELEPDFRKRNSPGNIIAAFKERVQPSRDEMIEAVDGFTPMKDDLEEDDTAAQLNDLILPFAQASLRIAFLYEEGHFANSCIKSGLWEVLQQDPTCIRPLIKRLREAAEIAHNDKSKKVRIYPGLLEALAIDTRDYPQNSFLINTLKLCAPADKDIAPDFFNELAAGTGNRRELILGKSIVSSMVTVAAELFGIDPDEYMKGFAGRTDLWPEDLKRALNTYGAGRMSSEIADLKNLLRPFADDSRSRHLKSKIRITKGEDGNLALPSKRQRQKSQQGAGRGKAKNTGASYTGRRRGIASVQGLGLIELTSSAEEEIRPIQKFAVMRQITSHKKVPRFVLDEASSLDELFERSNLQACIDHYKGDETVARAIRGGIEHLILNPRDPRYTKKSNIPYLVDGDERAEPRGARRFRPQHFPGVPGSSVGARLRIVYNVHGSGDNRMLVIYGAIPKEDLEDYSSLPRRRWR